MKKLLSALLVGALLAVPITADEPYYTDYDYAPNRLYALGLFRGTDVGFELPREATRAEAVTMIVRLLDAEEEALAENLPHPFSDVPEWASPYIGWAYQNGVTNGISDTEFGSSMTVSAQMYVTMLLRALGYVDGNRYYGVEFSYDSPYDLANELYLFSYYYPYHAGGVRSIRNPQNLQTDDFTIARLSRQYMTNLSFTALFCLTDEGITLYEDIFGKIPAEGTFVQLPGDFDKPLFGIPLPLFFSPETTGLSLQSAEVVPFSLTIDGTTVSLPDRKLLRIVTDSVNFANMNQSVEDALSVYLPLFASLELLGVAYEVRGDDIHVTLPAEFSVDAAQITSKPAQSGDDTIYRTSFSDAERFTLYVNGEKVTPKARILTHYSGFPGGKSKAVTAFSRELIYDGELYMQLDVFADMLGISTDFVQTITTTGN